MGHCYVKKCLRQGLGHGSYLVQLPPLFPFRPFACWWCGKRCWCCQEPCVFGMKTCKGVLPVRPKAYLSPRGLAKPSHRSLQVTTQASKYPPHLWVGKLNCGFLGRFQATNWRSALELNSSCTHHTEIGLASLHKMPCTNCKHVVRYLCGEQRSIAFCRVCPIWVKFLTEKTKKGSLEVSWCKMWWQLKKMQHRSLKL